MDWDRIAKSWTQFVASALPPRHCPAKISVPSQDSIKAVLFIGGAYEDGRVTPHVPDARDERSSFSQHLGC